MKKYLLLLYILLLFSVPLSASEIYVSAGWNWNMGLDKFFLGENDDGPDDSIRMGIGYFVSLNLPVYKRFFVVPEAGIDIAYKEVEQDRNNDNGNGKYSVDITAEGDDNGNYEYGDDNGGEDKSKYETSRFYYLTINSLAINLGYDIIRLADDCEIFIMFGLRNSTVVKSHHLTGISKRSYLSYQPAVGLRFFFNGHWGFQALTSYRQSLEDDDKAISFYLNNIGLSYRY